MSFKTRLLAIERRNRSISLDRIRHMTTSELDAAARGMFAQMEQDADPVHAAHIRAAAVWCLEASGSQHPEFMRIMQAVCHGPLEPEDIEIITKETEQ